MRANTGVKDSRVTIRICSEILEEIRAEAKAEHLSVSDFFLNLYRDSKNKKDNNLEERVKVLEQALLKDRK